MVCCSEWLEKRGPGSGSRAVLPACGQAPPRVERRVANPEITAKLTLFKKTSFPRIPTGRLGNLALGQFQPL